jgi:site-specific DNA recombinase
MPKPAIYLRVSSDVQREKGSIQSQEGALIKWLELQGLTAAEVLWYRDDGVSGKDPILERGDGARLAADIRAGAVSGFVAAFSISRLARDAADFHAFRTFLRDHDLHLLGAAEGIDTRAETGEFVAGIHALIAEESHRAMVKAIRAGKQRVALAGKWQAKAPYGYTVTEGRLEIDPASADTVRGIFARYLEGAGTEQIATSLNAEGIPPSRGGGRWHQSAVAVILMNRAYIGEAQWNRTRSRRNKRMGQNPRAEHITIPCPPIIDGDTFERAQAVRAYRGKQSAKTGAAARVLMLSRVRCQLCGAPFNRALYSGGQHAPYYRHSRYSPAYKACPSRNVSGPLLDGVVWQELYNAIQDPEEWYEALVERHRASQAGENAERRSREARAALKGVTDALVRLEDAYLGGAMALDRYAIRERELNKERERWQARIAEIEDAAAAKAREAHNAASLAKVMDTYRAIIENPTLSNKQEIAARLLSAVTVAYTDALRVDLAWSA